MQEFKNILVGIDLSAGDRLVGDELSSAARHVFDRAAWLAQRNEARLTLLYSIDVDEHAQHMIEEQASDPGSLLQQVRSQLAGLQSELSERGIAADVEIAFGRSWLVLLRRVLSAGHDLVILGTRNHSGLHAALIGSTATKLLRKCPCPVWVTKPEQTPPLDQILVAHDLSEVGQRALKLGVSMAELNDAKLHVVHVVDKPKLDALSAAAGVDQLLDEKTAETQAKLQAEMRGVSLSKTPEVTALHGAPAASLLDYISHNEIDLLVMGTVARAGIPGFFVGNTAERLLPSVPCSIMAVKPEGFQSPVV